MAAIEISCIEVWREISNYIDHEVEPQLRARMSEHFKHCHHCSAILDGSQNVVTLVADGEVFEVPKGFSSRLYSKINTLKPDCSDT